MIKINEKKIYFSNMVYTKNVFYSFDKIITIQKSYSTTSSTNQNVVNKILRWKIVLGCSMKIRQIKYIMNAVSCYFGLQKLGHDMVSSFE